MGGVFKVSSSSEALREKIVPTVAAMAAISMFFIKGFACIMVIAFLRLKPQ